MAQWTNKCAIHHDQNDTHLTREHDKFKQILEFVSIMNCFNHKSNNFESSLPKGHTRILTLYVLNFAEETLIFIYILCRYSTLTSHSYLKSFLI